MAGWADLEHLMLSGTLVTNRCLTAVATFDRLAGSDIGGTAITSSGIVAAKIPHAVQDLGLFDIHLGEDAVRAIASLPKLRAYNCNGCDLSNNCLLRFLQLPSLRSIEAYRCRYARFPRRRIYSCPSQFLATIGLGCLEGWQRSPPTRIRGITKSCTRSTACRIFEVVRCYSVPGDDRRSATAGHSLCEWELRLNRAPLTRVQ